MITREQALNLFNEMRWSAEAYARGDEETASMHEARIDSIIEELTDEDPSLVKDEIRDPLWWDDNAAPEHRMAIILRKLG